MRYLLTGVAGFIASKLAEFLLRNGQQVVGIDNLNEADALRVKDWRLKQLIGRPGFEFQQVDLCDRAGLESLWLTGGPFEAVLNLAARTGVRQSLEDPHGYFETNTLGVLNLLDLCRRHGVKKFIQASSSSLYGAHLPVPYQEDADTSRLLSPYAASKKAAEVLCYTYHHLYALEVVILRYFTVYGPAGRPDMLPFRCVQAIVEGRPLTIFGDGQQARDFTYVDDIVRGTLAALSLPGYTLLNLGAGQPVTLLSVIHTLEALSGRQARLEFQPTHPADALTTWADIGRARKCLGWKPQVDFEQGLDRLLQWYLENRDWAAQVHG
jgi:UDP-glucuronate 4-epimerase